MYQYAVAAGVMGAIVKEYSIRKQEQMAELVAMKKNEMVWVQFDSFTSHEGRDAKDVITERGGDAARAILAFGTCTNDTGETILVYGSKHPEDTSPYEDSMYYLPAGRTTPDGWDCDGFFVPNDRIASQALSDVQGPCAIKYLSQISWTVTKGGNKYNCPLNQGLFKPSEIGCPSSIIPYRVCWPIPDIPQSAIENSAART
jgi:hypothetical protein